MPYGITRAMALPCDKQIFPCAYPEWDAKREMTSFYRDFKIAECFRVIDVKRTFNRAFNEWKDNYKYLTELAAVVNHLLWEHYEGGKELAKLYNEWWDKVNEYANTHFTGEALSHFHWVLD